jgi:hypothetical protein
VAKKASMMSALRVCRTGNARAARAASPPEQVAEVKPIACELPKHNGVPLSRCSRSELHRFVVERGVSDASALTIGRWLAQDAIKPWRYRSWIFPRDPDFLVKAVRAHDRDRASLSGDASRAGSVAFTGSVCGACACVGG